MSVSDKIMIHHGCPLLSKLVPVKSLTLALSPPLCFSLSFHYSIFSWEDILWPRWARHCTEILRNKSSLCLHHSKIITFISRPVCCFSGQVNQNKRVNPFFHVCICVWKWIDAYITTYICISWPGVCGLYVRLCASAPYDWKSGMKEMIFLSVLLETWQLRQCSAVWRGVARARRPRGANHNGPLALQHSAMHY